jgi:hypothetical protein
MILARHRATINPPADSYRVRVYGGSDNRRDVLLESADSERALSHTSCRFCCRVLVFLISEWIQVHMSTSVHRTSRDPVSEHGRPMCDNNCRQLNGSFLLGVQYCMLIRAPDGSRMRTHPQAEQPC